MSKRASNAPAAKRETPNQRYERGVRQGLSVGKPFDNKKAQVNLLPQLQQANADVAAMSDERERLLPLVKEAHSKTDLYERAREYEALFVSLAHRRARQLILQWLVDHDEQP